MTREEAIEVLKEKAEYLESDKRFKAAVETLFPDEDENIRQGIVETIKQCTDILDPKNQKQMLAWLEKQKESPESSNSIPSDCVSDAKCENRWHKVGDSLPDNPREVLCKDEARNYFIGRYYVGEGWEISNYDDVDKPHHLNPPVSKWIDFPSEKQKEQKPRKFKLGDKIHWRDDGTNVITITGFRNDAYLTDSAYGPILFCDEDNWERIEQKQCIYGDTPSVERCAVCSAWCDIRVREDKQRSGAKLTGWVARDKDTEMLNFYRDRPPRRYDFWAAPIDLHLPDNGFPDLKWEDEPMAVEITVTKK